jgi:hypothetical protein
VVQQRPSRRRLEVAGRHGRLRGRARGDCPFPWGTASDAIVFTRNTTDSANLLSSTLPQGTRVLAFAVEHHANMLPWRRHGVTYLAIPPDPDGIIPALDNALAAIDGPVLVAMTGASNVTGERWPVAEAAEVAHKHGARIFIDAAQLAPHVPIDMLAWDVDYLALSGHKLYAPYGAGVLAGRPDWLAQSDPFLRGGERSTSSLSIRSPGRSCRTGRRRHAQHHRRSCAGRRMRGARRGGNGPARARRAGPLCVRAAAAVGHRWLDAVLAVGSRPPAAGHPDLQSRRHASLAARRELSAEYGIASAMAASVRTRWS